MNWKLIKSEYLFKDLWFTVRKDTCERSGGQIVDPYYVYEFPEWVSAVAITKEGKFILERQYRHAAGSCMLEIPGGCVDKEDSGLEAAIRRELKEETGYTFETCMYLGKTSANPSTNNNWMHFFLATGGELTAEQVFDQHEEIELVFLTLDEVKELLNKQEIIQSMHVTALFYALQKLGAINW